jgi:hypothetical protein
MDHSNYSPSRLKRIIECPGSVALIESLEISKAISTGKQSSYAAHGTHLHHVFERFYNDQGAEEYYQLDKDDQFLVRECVDYLDVLLKSKGHTNYMVKAETQVNLGSWGIPDVWGTSDYQIIDPMKRHIDVIDWKFGSGVPVYAKENPQLLAYAAGAIGWPTTLQTVTLHVVQPAIENFTIWEITVDELYEWVHGTLAIAINRAACETELFNPGVEQCRWCEAQNHCRTRFEYAQEWAVKIFEANKVLASCPAPEELAKLIDMFPLVEKAYKSILFYAQTEMMKGTQFPGLKLVQGRSNRKWVDEKKAVEWLSKNTEIDELFTSKLRSPSQMEKELKWLKKNDDFKKLYEQPPGKVTLVGESDKRPAIQAEQTAIDVFADYQAPDKLE